MASVENDQRESSSRKLQGGRTFPHSKFREERPENKPRATSTIEHSQIIREKTNIGKMDEGGKRFFGSESAAHGAVHACAGDCLR